MTRLSALVSVTRLSYVVLAAAGLCKMVLTRTGAGDNTATGDGGNDGNGGGSLSAGTGSTTLGYKPKPPLFVLHIIIVVAVLLCTISCAGSSSKYNAFLLCMISSSKYVLCYA
jgi:hypothetical protein